MQPCRGVTVTGTRPGVHGQAGVQVGAGAYVRAAAPASEPAQPHAGRELLVTCLGPRGLVVTCARVLPPFASDDRRARQLQVAVRGITASQAVTESE
eukprot:1210599-Rhodomonas_salina.1